MKISLIGGGNIGGTLAHIIYRKNLAKELVILDVNEGMAKGKALDLAQSGPLRSSNLTINGSSNYEDIKDSKVIIITAGISRKPGMSRDDLLNTNASIIKDIGGKIAKYAPDAFVIVITNPLDIMTFVAYKTTGFAKEKIVGMAGVLDSVRFCYFLAQELKVAPAEIKAIVMGSHGDTMVPLINYCSVAGVPIRKFIELGIITSEKINSIIMRTKNGGAEIVELLKSGSAYYAPAEAAIEMAESYIKDQRKILTCSVNLNGRYGVNEDIFCGAPVIISDQGIEKILELKLEDEEERMFKASIAASQELAAKISL